MQDATNLSGSNSSSLCSMESESDWHREYGVLISASLVPLPFLALQYMPGKVVGTRPLCATLLYLMGSGVCTLLMEGPLDIGDAFEGDMLISALRRPHTCETGGNVAYFCLLCPTKLR